MQTPNIDQINVSKIIQNNIKHKREINRLKAIWPVSYKFQNI